MVGGWRRSKQGIHSPPSLLAPDLQGAGELGNSSGPSSRPEETLGGFEVPTVVGTVGHVLKHRLLTAHQGQKLIAVAGGAPQAYAFYGTELVDALRFAAGYLFKVGVVQDDVGGDLLASRLISAPCP
jgi:hypothetical protein